MSAQKYEYMMQGSVTSAGVHQLLDRLRGISDNEMRHGHYFEDHEMQYVLKGGGSEVKVCARKSLSDATAPWSLQYYGQADSGQRGRNESVRSCITCGTTENLRKFLHDLGFQLSHEYVVKGYLFTKGSVRILITQICRIVNGVVEDTKPLTTSHLVQLSVMAAHGQESVIEELRTLADVLRPLVVVGKVEPRLLKQTQSWKYLQQTEKRNY